MKKALIVIALLELLYLFLSLYLAELFGQWSYYGEIARAFLRVISLASFYFFYRQFVNHNDSACDPQKLLHPPFLASMLLFLALALLFTNAGQESFAWQYVFAVAGLLAGFREELLYRGIIQQLLQRRFHYRTALLLSCFLFTASHIQYLYYQQHFALLMVFLAGIIFGCIFLYTGSVFIAGLTHGLYDAILAVKVTSFRLTPDAALIMLLGLALLFLVIASKQSSLTRTDNRDPGPQNTFSPQ